MQAYSFARFVNIFFQIFTAALFKFRFDEKISFALEKINI